MSTTMFNKTLGCLLAGSVMGGSGWVASSAYSGANPPISQMVTRDEVSALSSKLDEILMTQHQSTLMIIKRIDTAIIQHEGRYHGI